MHFGDKKTYQLMEKHVFWRGMQRDVSEFIEHCHTCQLSKKRPDPKAGKLMLFSATRPFESWVIDILGPFTETPRHNRWCLTMICRYTRWLEIVPLDKIDSVTIADKLFNYIVCRFSVPRSVQSDRGSNFLAPAVARLSARCGFTRVTSTPYHAACQGSIERTHRWISLAFRNYVDPSSYIDWDLICDQVAFAARITHSAATKYSSFFLSYGFHPRMPTDILYGDPNECETDINKYGLRLTKALREIHKKALAFQKNYDEKRKTYYDASHHDVRYEIGSQVSLYTPKVKPGISRKLQKTLSGPYTVKKRISRLVYQISPGVRGQETQNVHVQRLVPYKQQPHPRLVNKQPNKINGAPNEITDLEKNISIPEEKGELDEMLNEDSVAKSPTSDNVARRIDKTAKLIDHRKVAENMEYLRRKGTDQNWIPRRQATTQELRAYNNLLRSRRAERRQHLR